MWEIFGKPKTNAKRENRVESLHQLKLTTQIIDKSFSFYNLDYKYKNKAYDCFREIFSSDFLKKKFLGVYSTLYVSDSDDFRELWQIKDVEVLFGNSVNPFVTNLMILLGSAIHQAKMKNLKFNKKQIDCHKTRVRECFTKDLENRGYEGIRVSQMLWATYFINCRIIEVGNLQYEFDGSIDKIKIHVPHMPKLDMEKVKESLFASKKIIKKYFRFDDKQYICNSWLLSKQLSQILDNNSNIKKFQTLFKIKDGDDCTGDILNHVYGLKSCDDYGKLPEKTSLQRKIKAELMKGTIFRLGCGQLIWLLQTKILII